mmetsp:Transcript_8396/g.9763  ORF Transcript_8396/g.9763 Transcript_8396/m.9763 type:complete len:346 (-) Transcript_8396:664-1701(-)
MLFTAFQCSKITHHLPLTSATAATIRHRLPTSLLPTSIPLNVIRNSSHQYSTTPGPGPQSQYEDYNKTSKTYDQFRSPIGLEAIRKAMAANANLRGIPLKDYTLLDAGCGSGNYLAALQDNVGSIRGMEANEGMLEKAKDKLGDDVVFMGDITNMPAVLENSFDCVLTTQVLHHLEPKGSTEFTKVRLACEEVYKCLKPGGMWIISTQTPEQHIDGFWWAPVIPTAASTLAKRFPSLTALKEMMEDAGFDDFETQIPPEPLVNIDAYLDIEGPFKKGFRDADSTWSLASPQELEQGLQWLRKKIETDGDKFLKEREAIRAVVGQTTTVIVRKPENMLSRSRKPVN